MESVLFVGCDVHSKTISLCTYDPICSKYSYEAKIDNDIKFIWKYAKNIESSAEPGTKLVFGYEAGCLGFYLARQIQKLGYNCFVMAPTTIRTAQSDRIRKTDRRDARSIAQALACNGYSAVHIPDDEDETVRAYIRMREDHQNMVKKTKQQINAFVLKLGCQYDGKSKWTIAHRKWLKNLELTEMNKLILDEYLTTLEELENKVSRFDEKITALSREERYKDLADRLSCFKGITRPIAMRIITETGDMSRFSTAGRFASYLGLTPSEYSSGDSQVKGAITKMGNSHLRRTLIEAAQSAIKGVPGRKSKNLLARQSGCDPKVIHYADKGNVRFITKFKKMTDNGKQRNQAVTAVAREMACFIWGMATNHTEEKPADQAGRVSEPVTDPITGEVRV